MYGPETTRAIWAHDLSLLARHDWGGETDGASPATAANATPVPAGITVLDAYAPSPRDSAAMAIYLTVHNGSAQADASRAAGRSTTWSGRKA
ncbi:MAG: hypothetical protein P8170_18005 [Gemmatimonadota bacterium]